VNSVGVEDHKLIFKPEASSPPRLSRELLSVGDHERSGRRWQPWMVILGAISALAVVATVIIVVLERRRVSRAHAVPVSSNLEAKLPSSSSSGLRHSQVALAPCTPEGEDPYAAGQTSPPCCEGLSKQLGNWDGVGRWTYRCMPPRVSDADADAKAVLAVTTRRPTTVAVTTARPVKVAVTTSKPVVAAPVILPAMPARPPPAAGPVTRFMTFNVFCANNQWDKLALLIGRIDPDIAVIEEIPSFGQKQALVGALNRHGSPFQWAPSPIKQDLYDGHIMYRTDKFKVLESGTLVIDQRKKVPGLLRGVHWAVMERTDGKRVLIYGTHPSYDPMPSKIPKDWPAMDVFHKLSTLMKSLAAKWKCPAVVMCDCNTWTRAQSMLWLESGASGIKFKMAATADIDHILTEVGPKYLGNTLNPGVVHQATVGVRRPEWAGSDHPPVYLDVKFS